MIVGKYDRKIFINIEKILYNGETVKYDGFHCCEVVKKKFHKCKTIILKNPKENIKYSQEEINKWINLLKDNKFQFQYKIDDNYHYIILNTFDYNHVNHMYFTLILIRYLWYKENNCLIERIFDILSYGKLTFLQALTLAHYYDDLTRDNVFNLNYNFVFFNLNQDYFNLSFEEFNKYLKLNEFISKIYDEHDLYLYGVIFQKIQDKINENVTYVEVYKLIDYIYNNVYVNKPKIEKYFNIKIQEIQVKDLILGEEYIIPTDSSVFLNCCFQGNYYDSPSLSHYFKFSWVYGEELCINTNTYKFYKIEKND